MKKIIYLAPLALLGIGAKVSADQVPTHISNALRVLEKQQAKRNSQSVQDKQTNLTSFTEQPTEKNGKEPVVSSPNGQLVGQPIGKREGQQAKESASNLPNGQNDEQLDSFVKKSVETIQPVMPKKQVLATHISMLDDHQTNQLNVQSSPNTNIDYRESKSEIPNNNWADPINNGYHKTSVGWVYNKSNYPNLAKTSSVALTGTENVNYWSKDGDITNIAPNVDVAYLYHSHIKATIDKNMISHAAGKTILLGSIAVLNQDQRFNEIGISTNGDPYVFVRSNNQTIGYITSDAYSTYDYPSSHPITGYPDGQNYHALYFVLHVTSDLNFADDIKIDSQGPDIQFNWWNTQYYGLRGTTKDNPLHTKLITNDQTYNITTGDADHNPVVDPWTNNNLSDNQGRELNLSYYLNNHIDLTGSEFTRDPNSKFADRDYHSVYQISSLPNDNGLVNQLVIGNITANSRARLDVPTDDGWHLVNAWSPVNYDTQFGFKKLTNNLSSQQVYDAANQSNSGTYSVQNDGSVIISTNFNPTTFFKLGSQSLKAFKASVLNGYAYNVWCKTDTERQNLLNNLQKQLEKSDYQAMATEIEIFGLALQHPDQVGRIALTNLTPNMANTTKIKPYIPRGISLSSSQYQQINLKFVDDDNHEKVISTKPIFEGNGHDLYISFDKKITVPNDAKLQQIALPVGVTLNNSQSDLNNYNADTKVFHYGTVKLTNPDVIIHVRHQIKHVDNPSISDLKLNATKNIHLINSNKTALTGQTVSWGVKYTKDLYTSLVTADLNSKKALTDPNDFKNNIHVPSLDGYNMIHSNLSYLQL